MLGFGKMQNVSHLHGCVGHDTFVACHNVDHEVWFLCVVKWTVVASFFLFLCFFATGAVTRRPYTMKTHTEAYKEKDLFVSDERHDLCVGLSFLKGRQGINGTFLVHLFQLKQQPDRVHGR